MRTFILFSRKARTDSNFNLEDLAGSGGKMDTVCRFITASLWISHGLRRDTDVYVVLNGSPNPPVTIRFIGESLRRVDPNERAIAIWIKKALKLIEDKKDKEWYDLDNGIMSSRKSFQEIVKAHSERPIFVLEEKGKNIEKIKIEENPVIICGDSVGLPKKDEKFALRYGQKISIGKTKYFASACATIINWILDEKGL